jgi:hypothetical protein
MGGTPFRRSPADASAMSVHFSEITVRVSGRMLFSLVTLLAVSACVQRRDLSVAVGTIMTPGNTQIPLPRGDWRTLAEEKFPGQNHYVEAYYALAEGGTLKSLVFVSTSADAPVFPGYSPNQGCILNSSQGITYLHQVDGMGRNYSECLRVVYLPNTFAPPGERSSPLYKRFYDAASALGGVPRRVILVNSAAALGQHYMNYTMYFFPERDGVQSTRWERSDLGPVEKTYVDEIVSWAKKFHPAVAKGTQNQLQ